MPQPDEVHDVHELIQSLLPPSVPSLSTARHLASILPTFSPLPTIHVLLALLNTLCDTESPVSVRCAGYDILAAYCENPECDFGSWSMGDRMAVMSFFVGGDWVRPLWEPEFKALRAVTKWGSELLGIEENVVELLKEWIESAFFGLGAASPSATTTTIAAKTGNATASPSISSSSNHHHENEDVERERSIKILCEFLNAIASNTSVIARIADIQTRQLDLYSKLYLKANHSTELALDLYLSYLHNLLPALSSPQILQSILSLLFTALARCATPLPRLTASFTGGVGGGHEKRIQETLQTLLTGTYPTTCMNILVSCLDPDPHTPTVTVGALRALRTHIRQTLATRLARLYIARQSSVSYTYSGAPTNLPNFPLDQLTWTSSTGGVGWDAGRWAKPLKRCARTWIAVPEGLSTDVQERVLEELAGVVKDVLQEVDLREEYADEDNGIDGGGLEDDEAVVIGEVIYELAGYVHNVPGPPYIVPLTSPSPQTASTPFLRTLCTILARDLPVTTTSNLSQSTTPSSSTNTVNLVPPLTTTLLHRLAPSNMQDHNIALLIQLMSDQSELSPGGFGRQLISSIHLDDNAEGWLGRWRVIFFGSRESNGQSILTSKGKRKTKRTVMSALKEVHENIRDMPRYRRPLADLILRFLQEDKVKTGRELGSLWKLIGEEVVLRCVEATSTASSTQEDDIQPFLQILLDTAAAPESNEDEDTGAASDEEVGGGAMTPTQASIQLSRVASQSISQAREEKDVPEGLERTSQMPSVMSLLSSFSGGGDSEHSSRRNRSGSISLRGVAVDPVPTPAAITSSNLGNVFESDVDDKETPTTQHTPLNLLAVSALIEVFADLAFSGYASLGAPLPLPAASAVPTEVDTTPRQEDAAPLDSEMNLGEPADEARENPLLATLHSIHTHLITLLSPIQTTSTRVKLAILQFYLRLRADRDHKIYVVSEIEGNILSSGTIIGRTNVEKSSRHSQEESAERERDPGRDKEELYRGVGHEGSHSGEDLLERGRARPSHASDAVSELRRVNTRPREKGKTRSGWASTGGSVNRSASRSRSRVRRPTFAFSSQQPHPQTSHSLQAPPPPSYAQATKEKERKVEMLWTLPESSASLPFTLAPGDTGKPSACLSVYSPDISPANSQEPNLVSPTASTHPFSREPSGTTPPTPTELPPQILRISLYLKAILVLLQESKEWELVGYILIHLPSQLRNKHLFCGPRSKTIFAGFVSYLSTGVIRGTFASFLSDNTGISGISGLPSSIGANSGITTVNSSEIGPVLPSTLRPRDAHHLALHTLHVLIGYKRCYDLGLRRLLVEALSSVLSSTREGPVIAALQGLGLAVVELGAPGLGRGLKDILEKLSQSMSLSSPRVAVQVLGFLMLVGAVKSLYETSFTEAEFKLVFGLALKYLQVHNTVVKGDSPTKNVNSNNRDREKKPNNEEGEVSWALTQHVRILSYHVVYVWFLAVKLEDRPKLLLANSAGSSSESAPPAAIGPWGSESDGEVDDVTEVAFDWLARYTYASADPRPTKSVLGDIVFNTHKPASPDKEGSSGLAGASSQPVSEKTWLQGNSVVTIRTLPKTGWVEVLSRRPSGYTKFLGRVENVPLVGPGECEPDYLTVRAGMLIGRDEPRPINDLEEVEQPSQETETIFPDLEEGENTMPRPDPITGYVWSRTAPSQRRKEVSIDPAFLALQLSPYPYHRNVRLLVDPSLTTRFFKSLDRMPVIDTHKVGVLYVAPSQTSETDILRNTHGSPAYTRFLEGLGRLIDLRGQIDVYAGGLDPDEDGDYAYAWWDDIGQILYHVATMMPNHPDDPESVFKKRHIGNDFVRIVWNDSGRLYRFDTLSTQFQFINIVIEPHSLGAISAFSNNLHENEYFRVSVQRCEGMPEFAPIPGDGAVVSEEGLPTLIRQIGLLADWFAYVFSKTERDTIREEIRTNWQERLGAIKRLRRQVEQNAKERAEKESEEGGRGMTDEDRVLRQERFRDFTGTL
ncbi:Tuberous sclerosis 2-like protein [Paramarasmius palmivorus]|uniref:Tuberous sclerosis 2-like protein n=1 Tax=Paramarasmius palmivorus TaxID=297713 RepID=A0AAW0CBY4_9AGAR